MVEQLDYGYREELWLEYKGRAGALGDMFGNRMATKLNGEITKFIKEECANLVRVIEGSELSALRSRLLETSSLLGSRSKESKKKRERSPSEAQVVADTCPVCQGQIKPSETTVSCPYCHMDAHRVHLLEWIHVKGSRPSCRKPLRADEIKEPESIIYGEMR